MRAIEMEPDRVNAHGGAIALAELPSGVENTATCRSSETVIVARQDDVSYLVARERDGYLVLVVVEEARAASDRHSIEVPVGDTGLGTE